MLSIRPEYLTTKKTFPTRRFGLRNVRRGKASWYTYRTLPRSKLPLLQPNTPRNGNGREHLIFFFDRTYISSYGRGNELKVLRGNYGTITLLSYIYILKLIPVCLRRLHGKMQSQALRTYIQLTAVLWYELGLVIESSTRGPEEPERLAFDNADPSQIAT